ncbi:MAG: glycosyltransferase family 2 protein [Eubacteriaceae bacterium]|nr:glycosyltransferase family 2 protein [Eubacteriaceae bacterium]
MVSIIIPAYNVENYIGVTLNSLLAQTDTDFEIIVINDGSKDNTSSIARELLSGNEAIASRVIDKENGGVSSARNLGIREATGEYLYFLDGDDYVAKNFISTLNKTLQKTGSDVIAWGFDHVNEDKSTAYHYFESYRSDLTTLTGIQALKKILKKELWIWTCSAIYRRELIMENGLIYTEGCSNGEDQEFTFKAVSMAREVYFIQEVLSFYVQRKGSISNTFNLKRFDAANSIKRIAAYIRSHAPGEGEELAKYLEHNHLVENYFFNFNSCIDDLHKAQGLSRIQGAKLLLKDIEKAYPGLNKEIRKKIKLVTDVDLTTRLRYRSFLLTPALYFLIRDIKERISNRE